jgi:hypothetical protein
MNKAGLQRMLPDMISLNQICCYQKKYYIESGKKDAVGKKAWQHAAIIV